MKLPKGSAEVKKYRKWGLIPEGVYDVEVTKASIDPIPHHVREEFSMKATHSVNIEMQVLSGEYRDHLLYDTLYPIVDGNGLPTRAFAAALENYEIDTNVEFDTEAFRDKTYAVVVRQLPKRSGGLKNQVVVKDASEIGVSRKLNELAKQIQQDMEGLC